MSDSSTDALIAVTDQAVRHRFEITVDGESAGYTEYKNTASGALAFVHTAIDPDFEGRGLGSKLIGAALDEMRSRGASVLPFCPFVKGFIVKRPDYVNLVPEDRRPEFGL